MISEDFKPTPEIAESIVASLTKEKIISSKRLATGDQNFVFDVLTSDSEFVLRMTSPEQCYKFEAAIYWQKLLLPLGVPLAPFVASDLQGQHSLFPSLLMPKLPGTDLCHAYPTLSEVNKRNIAKEIVNIQSKLQALPDGVGYGIADSYQQELPDKSWYDFIVNRLFLFRDIIKQTGLFNETFVDKALNIAKQLESSLKSVTPRPFLWDASERNVLIHRGQIAGIVDVDEICFGDPLFVIALTHVALTAEGQDSIYTDYWEKMLQLDEGGRLRLQFYKLFYVIVFMRKHGMMTNNKKEVLFNTQVLIDLFDKLCKIFGKQ